jgi:hypothetical protein
MLPIIMSSNFMRGVSGGSGQTISGGFSTGGPAQADKNKIRIMDNLKRIGGLL